MTAEPARSIEKMGFKRWYERQLLESHAWLVSCILCALAVCAVLELVGLRVSSVAGVFTRNRVENTPPLCSKASGGRSPARGASNSPWFREVALAAIGCAIGISGALAGLRALQGLLFGLSPTDTVNLAGAAVILVLVSLAAAVVRARRAAAVDPLVALRYD